MSFTKTIYMIASTALLVLPVVSPESASAQGSSASSGKAAHPGVTIPSSVEAEHKELHAHLAKILKSGGRTAAAAKDVEKRLHPHFVKEEEFALPPLGLLSALASGQVPTSPDNIIKMSDRLKAEMPQMLREHKEIVGALEHLRTAAQAEHKTDAVQFAEELMAHATQEEQILYPSAILVGEYLKLKR